VSDAMIPPMKVCVSGWTDWLNAEIVIVPDAPFSDWLRVTLFPPANTIRTCAPDATPVVPDVLPMLDIPIDWLSADWEAAEMVMVPLAPFKDCERVTLFPPASRNLICAPEAMPVVPLVLPMFDIPND